MKRLLLLTVVAVAGCADPSLPLAPEFGNAVHNNIAAQVVNPLPPGPSASDTDGQRVGNAIERYRTNTVYPPHLPLESGKVHTPTPPEGK